MYEAYTQPHMFIYLCQEGTYTNYRQNFWFLSYVSITIKFGRDRLIINQINTHFAQGSCSCILEINKVLVRVFFKRLMYYPFFVLINNVHIIIMYFLIKTSKFDRKFDIYGKWLLINNFYILLSIFRAKWDSLQTARIFGAQNSTVTKWATTFFQHINTIQLFSFGNMFTDVGNEFSTIGTRICWGCETWERHLVG